MSATAIAGSELRELLAAAGGSYVAAFDRLVTDEATKAIEASPRSTVATRKAAWKQALRVQDSGVLDLIKGVLTNYATLARKNSTITAAPPHVLDDGEARDLMTEVLNLKKAKEFFDARYEEIRQTVFASMTEDFAEQGEQFPEHVSGSIDVPALGTRFCREGTGRKDPALDEEILAELIGEQAWEQITDVEFIPAHEERTLNTEKLMELAHSQPAVLEHIRSALKVGDWKSARFVIRDLKPEE